MKNTKTVVIDIKTYRQLFRIMQKALALANSGIDIDCAGKYLRDMLSIICNENFALARAIIDSRAVIVEPDYANNIRGGELAMLEIEAKDWYVNSELIPEIRHFDQVKLAILADDDNRESIEFDIIEELDDEETK
jgi:hypothetical protein